MKRTSVMAPVIAAAITLCTGLAVGGSPAQASATSSTRTTAAARTRADIARAATHSRFTRALEPSTLSVSQIRISSGGHWASARIRPTNGATDPAQVLLVRSGRRWVAKDLGTEGVGCGIISHKLRTKLRLYGSCR